MTKKHRPTEAEQVAALVELEEKLGSIVPGGAQGGVAVRSRVRANTSQKKPSHAPAGARARSRVRGQFQAKEKSGEVS